mmetsp:Transcript_619/g.1709  ORF Transcript_619/g.1709 Transcript_619/m.1709 type:complete len:254 (+) Transcript_619:398-1159(+)
MKTPTRRLPPFTKGAPRARVRRAPRSGFSMSGTTKTSTRRSTRATGAKRSARCRRRAVQMTSSSASSVMWTRCLLKMMTRSSSRSRTACTRCARPSYMTSSRSSRICRCSAGRGVIWCSVLKIHRTRRSVSTAFYEVSMKTTGIASCFRGCGPSPRPSFHYARTRGDGGPGSRRRLMKGRPRPRRCACSCPCRRNRSMTTPISGPPPRPRRSRPRKKPSGPKRRTRPTRRRRPSSGGVRGVVVFGWTRSHLDC